MHKQTREAFYTSNDVCLQCNVLRRKKNISCVVAMSGSLTKKTFLLSFTPEQAYTSCLNGSIWKVIMKLLRRFNPIQDGLFQGCSQMRWGGAFWPLLPKFHHTYPAMMKLGTVIPYLRKIQKMYKSRETSLEFCWHQHFFTGNQQILLHQKIDK